MTRFKTIAAISALAAAGFSAQPAHATLYEIVDILSNTESKFQFSVFHDADKLDGMSGDVVAEMDAITGNSYFDDADGDFQLGFTLVDVDNGGMIGSGQMTGDLDFNEDTIGTLTVEFSDFSFDGKSEFELTFLNADYGHDLSEGTDEGPGPNDFNGTFLSLWGAEGDPLTFDPASDDFGGFNTNTTTIGLDLVIQLTENPNITETPEPASLAIIGTGLLAMGLAGGGLSARRRKNH